MEFFRSLIQNEASSAQSGVWTLNPIVLLKNSKHTCSIVYFLGISNKTVEPVVFLDDYVKDFSHH